MENLKDRPRVIPLFPPTCGVHSGQFLPTIPVEEACYVTKECENPHDYNIITCTSPNREEFLKEVSGLELDLTLQAPDIKELPAYIPSTDINTAAFLSTNEQVPFLATTLKDITTGLTQQHNGVFVEAGKIIFRPKEQFEVFVSNPKLLLFLTGNDTAIEYAWRERVKYKILDAFKWMNLVAATGFNFSLFEGECVFAQQLNLKRSLFSSHVLEKNGISTIPHVYALNVFQVKRWVNWFKANPQVKYFAVNCQVEKSNPEIKSSVEIIKMILEAVPGLEVLLQGFQIDHAFRYGAFIERVHFVDSSACNKARNHIRIDVDFNGKLSYNRDQASYLELVLHNIKARALQIEIIRSQTLSRILGKTG